MEVNVIPPVLLVDLSTFSIVSSIITAIVPTPLAMNLPHPFLALLFPGKIMSNGECVARDFLSWRIEISVNSSYKTVAIIALLAVAVLATMRLHVQSHSIRAEYLRLA